MTAEPSAVGSARTGGADRGHDPRTVRKVMTASAIGHFVEWYDFAVYAYAAPVIATLFFPNANTFVALLSTFAVYAVGFVMRPIGAFLLGSLGDRIGRKRVLAGVILMMGCATTGIGLLPTYDMIGVLAPVLLVVLRLAQGFSAAGETIGSNSFVAEHAPRERRGFAVGMVYTWSNLPPVLAALLVWFLTGATSSGDYESWGWRVPFLLGAPLAVVGLYIRTRVDESPAFAAVKEAKRVSAAPIRTVWRDHRKEMGVCFGIAAVASLGYYSLTGYFFTYLTVTIKMGESAALLSNSIALTVTFLTVPLAAALSDRIGRKRGLQLAAALNALLAVPAYLLAGQANLTSAIISQGLLAFSLGLFFGPAGAAFVELFPAHTRYSGASISYNLAFTLFGGTAPLLSIFLIEQTGSTIAPAWYVVAVSVAALLVIARMPETSRRSMLPDE
ncbi:MFS transporter [Streptomyces viridiviolaceus]|uniref:MFS transporter n=1 Tax=Streptomyces viridiviolaceus TaxID=68282 RepID=A0ABW2E602_9ACTN|nr:MFS transporter [Streptomyces viridiviolaceus]GHB69987.1 MFS transporter [Streptomyces viridiviolaceus]